MENNKSGWRKMEIEKGKEHLKDAKTRDKITCFVCKNQTFILPRCADFPFFDLVCSKCGSGMVI